MMRNYQYIKQQAIIALVDPFSVTTSPFRCPPTGGGGGRLFNNGSLSKNPLIPK